MLKENSSLEQQLEELKVLSGIYKPYQPEETQQENISYTGTEKSKYQKKHNIEPGTKEWFKLWFTRPGLTGKHPYGNK
jgi:hypothetical protein|tara:strand:+ start:443 stop:676 length:234 start_codon:yes stop_codon:yes gene_type:complete